MSENDWLTNWFEASRAHLRASARAACGGVGALLAVLDCDAVRRADWVAVPPGAARELPDAAVVVSEALTYTQVAPLFVDGGKSRKQSRLLGDSFIVATFLSSTVQRIAILNRAKCLRAEVIFDFRFGGASTVLFAETTCPGGSFKSSIQEQ